MIKIGSIEYGESTRVGAEVIRRYRDPRLSRRCGSRLKKIRLGVVLLASEPRLQDSERREMERFHLLATVIAYPGTAET